VSEDADTSDFDLTASPVETAPPIEAAAPVPAEITPAQTLELLARINLFTGLPNVY
jgi:hypothetical protein